MRGGMSIERVVGKDRIGGQEVSSQMARGLNYSCEFTAFISRTRHNTLSVWRNLSGFSTANCLMKIDREKLHAFPYRVQR